MEDLKTLEYLVSNNGLERSCNDAATRLAWNAGDLKRVVELACRKITELHAIIREKDAQLAKCKEQSLCDAEALRSLYDTLANNKASAESLEACVNKGN